MVPHFRSRDMLVAHIADTLKSCGLRCGLSSLALAYRQFGDPAYLDAARQALAGLREGRAAIGPGDKQCSSLAFELQAYARAFAAGIGEARAWIDETFGLMERHFWEEQHGLYASSASPDWSRLSPSRGQSANMHACEALLAAYDACGDIGFLQRAETLARNITVRQAALANGLIWEHYHADWSIDWTDGLLQPGHFTAWARLLLILERHAGELARPSGWLALRAAELFDTALETAWDERAGGITGGFDTSGAICDGSKNAWVQAESLAAAALLGARTGQMHYWIWYDTIWEYCWKEFAGKHKGVACDSRHHTMAACHEVLKVIRSAP